MALLLKQADILAIRRISSTINADRFNSFAKEAEEVHLRMLLGDALYLDLISNIEDAKYVTLLAGENYKKPDGFWVKYFGLKIYLAYAWLFINTIEGDEFQANIGSINFNQQNAPLVKGKSNASAKYQDSMIIYKNNIIDYLNENAETYPLWQSTNREPRGKYTFDII